MARAFQGTESLPRSIMRHVAPYSSLLYSTYSVLRRSEPRSQAAMRPVSFFFNWVNICSTSKSTPYVISSDIALASRPLRSFRFFKRAAQSIFGWRESVSGARLLWIIGDPREIPLRSSSSPRPSTTAQWQLSRLVLVFYNRELDSLLRTPYTTSRNALPQSISLPSSTGKTAPT